MRISTLITISLFAFASAMQRANQPPAADDEVTRDMPARAEVPAFDQLEKRKGGGGKGGGVSIDVGDDDDGALQNIVSVGPVALMAVGATGLALGV